MEKRFILKGKDGRIRGYFLLCRDGVFCRLDAPCAAMLTLFDGDVPVARYDLPASSSEQQLDSCAQRVTGGVVSSGDKILCATGKDAVFAFDRIEGKKRAEQEKSSDVLGAVDSVESKAEGYAEKEEDALAGKSEAEWAALPQMRWPRPACMPHARYEAGRWM